MAEIEIGTNLLGLLTAVVTGLLAYWNLRLHKKCKHIKTS